MSRRTRIFLIGFGVGAITTTVFLRRPVKVVITPEQFKFITENFDRYRIFVTSQGVYASQLVSPI